MKKLMATYIKDMKLALRSFYIWLVLFFAFIFIVVMKFVVPKDMSGDIDVFGENLIVYIESDVSLSEVRQSFADLDEKTLVESKEDLLKALEKNRQAKGLVVSMEDGKMLLNYILQGYEGSATRELLKTYTRSGWVEESVEDRPHVTIKRLKTGNEKEMSMVDFITPIFLVMESALMGMFLVAAYVFTEKEEGTIRAYLVAPGSIMTYLASKVLMFVTFSLLSGLIAVFFLKGFSYNVVYFLPLLLVYSVFGTLLGLFLAAFFDNIQGAMLWIVLVAVAFTVSLVSYTMPSFSPMWIRLIPSYPMYYAIREIMYPTGNTSYLLKNIMGFLMVDIVLMILCNVVYKKRIIKFK